MASSVTDTQKVLDLASAKGAFKLGHARELGVHPEVVYRLARAGRLERAGRGVYELSGGLFTERHDFVVATVAVPRGIICLLSALSFHELTTQLPFEVWMAVDRRAASPRVDAVPLRLVRFSGAALHVGVEEHQIEGVAVRVTSLVRTVVDCFRYRNKYGIDIAVEALRDAVHERRATVGQIAECAAQLRMRNVMRPYLDMLVY